MGDTINGNKIVFGDNSQMINIQLNVDTAHGDRPQEFDRELLARAIENCQAYFWANSAYAVVFCICRDEFKMSPNKTAFEEMVEQLPYHRKRDHTCPPGTIANAFSDNPIFAESVREWDRFSPMPRIVKLRDELFRELKL